MNFMVMTAQPQAATASSDAMPHDMLGRLLISNRFALSMALVLAVAIPEFIHSFVSHFGTWFEITSTESTSVEPSLAGACLAIVAGHLSLRKIDALPLVSGRAIIFPTFLATFGAVALGLLTLHLQFGRYHLWTGLLITVAWYLALSIMRGRLIRPTIGLFGVPHGFTEKLPVNIKWQILEKPELPGRVAAVVVDPHADLTVRNAKFITQLVLDGTPVYHRDHFEEGLTGKVRFHSHADNNFGALLPSLAYLRVKHLIDFAAALVLLPAVLLVIAIAALAIKVTSPGPVIFTQTRTGFRGRPFNCYKLRTMSVGHAGPAFTVEQDPRITPLGKVLRKWRIDELPQIFNVLAWEMSWIGPRPEAKTLADQYSAHIPFYDYRHAVRPGITGWAAVHQGNVAEVAAAREKMEYDFFYIKYFSFWLDFLIVLKTVRTVTTGFGSR